jgi:hypothetical protein
LAVLSFRKIPRKGNWVSEKTIALGTLKPAGRGSRQKKKPDASKGEISQQSRKPSGCVDGVNPPTLARQAITTL